MKKTRSSLPYIIACLPLPGLSLSLSLGLSMGLNACATVDLASRRKELRQLQQQIIADDDTRTQTSRRLNAVLDDQPLDGMRRDEISSLLGPGDRCDQHPSCRGLGFDADDWYYTVGSPKKYSGTLPVMIVGFSREGKVERVWNLQVE